MSFTELTAHRDQPNTGAAGLASQGNFCHQGFRLLQKYLNSRYPHDANLTVEKINFRNLKSKQYNKLSFGSHLYKTRKYRTDEHSVNKTNIDLYTK